MKIGLVLEGGTMRGMYTAGILDRFLEENIVVDEVIGVSAGALFGVNYKSKQKGRAIRYNKKYLNDKNYMGLYSLIKTGNIMNKDFCFNELVNKLDVFDYDTYRNDKTLFFATVTNVNTGKAEYKNISDLSKKSDMEYLRASGSMPFVSKIVKVDDNYYLDGALSDSIPINKALKDCDKVIVVLTRPSGYRKKKKSRLYAKLFYSKYPKLVEAINSRYKVYNKTIDKINELESEERIFVFRPSKYVDIKRIEKDINKVEEMYNLGIKDFNDNYNKLVKYITRL